MVLLMVMASASTQTNQSILERGTLAKGKVLAAINMQMERPTRANGTLICVTVKVSFRVSVN